MVGESPDGGRVEAEEGGGGGAGGVEAEEGGGRGALSLGLLEGITCGNIFGISSNLLSVLSNSSSFSSRHSLTSM